MGELFPTQVEIAAIPASGIGWQAFSDLEFLSSMAQVLLLSIVLSATLAWHPSARKRTRTIDDIERPKTFVMYALVGTVIALIVRVEPSMALVVFGMGGLLRFRTDVGEAKDTGRVILVTVIGLCTGMSLYAVAVLATVFGWILIAVLEARGHARLRIQGTDGLAVARAAERYQTLLEGLGATIAGSDRRLFKGIVTIVVRVPRRFDLEKFDESARSLSESEHVSYDWDIS